MGDLNREFLLERDSQIFRLRRTGMSINDIAKRFSVSTSACSAAIKRQLERMNREALNAYPEMLRIEIERIDALQQAIWPLTQHRMVDLPDGTQIKVEPDLKAVAEVRALVAMRSKLLGLEQNNVVLSIEDAPQRATLAGHEKSELVVDPEQESRAMLKLMLESGVLDAGTLASMMSGEEQAALEAAEILDAEVIEA
jgi:predicted DNA-binding protein YlxM (UPF0122 family)